MPQIVYYTAGINKGKNDQVLRVIDEYFRLWLNAGKMCASDLDYPYWAEMISS